MLLERNLVSHVVGEGYYFYIRLRLILSVKKTFINMVSTCVAPDVVEVVI